MSVGEGQVRTVTDVPKVVIEALAKRPGASVRELLVELATQYPTLTKTDLNSLLYSDRSLFWNDGATPPRWRLVSQPTVATTQVGRSEALKSVTAVVTRRTRQPALPRLYAWQEEALVAWREAGRQAVVEAVTGTGKTMVGIAAVRESLAAGGKVMVVVPTIELLRQWTAQLRQIFPGCPIGQLGDGRQDAFGISRVIVAVVNSARVYDLGQPPPSSLLVADECHRYGSESNALALDTRFGWRLGLSATYARSDDGNQTFLDPYFQRTCFTMDYRRAVDDSVTARFKVALVGVRFSGGERAEYDEADRKANEARQWLLHNGAAPVEPFSEFMRAVKTLGDGGPGSATWKARSFLRNFAERRRILAETPAKRTRLIDLAPALAAADRSILFTQTVEAAEDAAKVVRRSGIKAKAIHSKLDSQERRQILGAFADGRLHVITAPQVLDEGIDVPAADLAVILASSKTRRQMIQRMGRVLRKKQDGRLARFAVLYVEGTAEDPAHGAHGDFLEEITTVADDVRSFSASDRSEAICVYLMDFVSRRPGALKAARSLSSAEVTPADRRGIPSVEPETSTGASSARLVPPALAFFPPAAKPPKKVRDRMEAARRGVTIEELLSERRREHEENLRLGDEARRLGLTAKQLRAKRASRKD